jgi:protein-tyrosine phosphatase
MIDLHCHVLPGIDDGPESIEGSLMLARAAAGVGITTLVATPHVSWRYRNDADTIAALAQELAAALVLEEVPVMLRAGAEVAMTQLADIEPSELARLTLGGGPWLLLEPPFTEVSTGFDRAVLDLQRAGHSVLLAHPERCQAFHRDPDVLGRLVQAGALTSITAGSLVGRFGSTVRRFALQLVREELVHNVSSDAHSHERRRPGIAAELEQAGLAGLSEWLTLEVPAAILEGEPIPARPAGAVSVAPPRRRLWTRRGRSA